MEISAKIHSIETLGTRDGPGLRCVFFLAGCDFRCQFCHNPDTWTHEHARTLTLEEAEEKITNLLPYLRQRNGGVTASGGEPTLQADFVIALFDLAHRLKVTTALDTNGSCPRKKQDRLLSATDTVMLDIKASTPSVHKTLTGRPLEPVLGFARRTADLAREKDTPGLFIRRVILPGITDTPEEIEAFIRFLHSLPLHPGIELLPYHTLGVYKWKDLDMKYPLEDLSPPAGKAVRTVADRCRKEGFEVIADHG